MASQPNDSDVPKSSQFGDIGIPFGSPVLIPPFDLSPSITEDLRRRQEASSPSFIIQDRIGAPSLSNPQVTLSNDLHLLC